MPDRSSPPSKPSAAARGAAAPGLNLDGPPFAGLLAEAGRAPADREAQDTAAKEPASRPERIQMGPYRILEEIGSGGMAVVFKALHPSLERLVAIKVLRPEYMHDRQIATRFEREATSLATLQHGNIVHVYDFGRENDQAYIVMEYVDGIDVFDILSHSQRLPPDVAALIAKAVAEGLEHAHHRGIIHRDIKPSNILVSKKGEVKIMDFGIARDPGRSDLTQIGLAVGTPAYMAPEQIRGDQVDFRTDIFALGIVLYEMLAGQKPWTEEDGRAITIKVLDEPLRPLVSVAPDVPPLLLEVVDRCLRKRPDHRYRSTQHLVAALDEYTQKVVTSDPRARLLVYLRNRQLISDREIASLVEPDLLYAPSVRRRDAGLPLPPAHLMLSPLVWAHTLALAVVILVFGLAVWGPLQDEQRPAAPRVALLFGDETPLDRVLDRRAPAASRTSNAGRDFAPPAGATPTNEATGYVRVIVEPWAHVWVDGQLERTTPFAAPLALSPGEHRIGLRNPYFQSEDRVVDVKPGETIVLKAVLRGGQPR